MKPVSGRGFTLIEVMIAMVILLVGMLGVMGMQYFAISGNTSSREMRVATSLSQEVIEQLTGTPFAQLLGGNDIPALGGAIAGGVNFTRAWWVVPSCVSLNLGGAAVTDCAVVPAAAACDPAGAAAVQSTAIRARTCWTDRHGTLHAVTLDSLIVSTP